MHEDPTRRDLLRAVAGIGAGAFVTSCTGTSGAPVPRPSSPSSAVSASPGSSGGLPTLRTLSRRLTGKLLRLGSGGYDTARRLYNPRFDATTHPRAIAQCATDSDVAECVRFLAAGGADTFALRSGGHSYGGWSSDRNFVVDVTRLNTVVVDTATATARIGAGARLADVYAALAAKGVAIAAGSCPTVGIAGLTLGGGVGVLARAFGLTCDAVRAIDIVTADSRPRVVGASHDRDLFWALRGGGGGSFGAVTGFTVDVRPAPTVTAFFFQWPLDAAESVVTAWQHWIAAADDKLWSTCKILAEPAHGSGRVVVAGTWIGPASQLQSQLAPLRSSINRPPDAQQANTLPYAAAMLLEAGCSGETASDCISSALSPAKRQPFTATSAILTTPLTADAIRTAAQVTSAALNISSMIEGGVSLDALGGAVGRVDPSATAFVHRDALATVQYTATWSDPQADKAPYDDFVHGLRAKLLRWTGPSAYVNYADPTFTDYATAYWGANYPRLQQVKRAYDPDNLFKFPQSVRP